MTKRGTRDGLGIIGRGVRQLLRQRWIKLLVLVGIIVLGVRLGTGYLLARVVDSLASERGLSCTWEDFSLSLFDGRGEIRFLEVRPLVAGNAEPEPALLEVEYATLDLDLGALFSGELRILRAEVDGLEALLERDASGKWNLERHIDVAQVLALLEAEPTEEAEPDEVAEEAPAPLDLTLPIAIEALRLQHARLHLVDATIEPPLDERIEFNARLSNLLTSERPALFSITAAGGELVDTLYVAGEATWNRDSIRSTLTAKLGGLHPRRMGPYLDALDLRPVAGTIEAGAKVAVEVSVTGEARDALAASLSITEIALAADGTEAVALDELLVIVERCSAERTVVPRIETRGLRARASREADGAWRVAGLDLLSRPSGETGGGPPSDPLGQITGILAPGELPRWAALLARRDPDAYPWSIGRVALTDGEIAIVDRSVTPETTHSLLIDRAELRDLVHDPALEPTAVALAARMRAPGLADEIVIEGSLLPFAPHRHLDVTVTVEGIRLESASPYLLEVGVEQTIERGRFHSRLVGDAETDETGRTTGWLELREVALEDSGELFGIRNLAARDLLLDPEARLLRFGNVEIAGPRLSFVREASDSVVAFGLRVLGFSAPPVEGGAAVEALPEEGEAEVEVVTPSGESETTTPTADAPAPGRIRIELARLAWTDSDVSFLDHTREPPVEVVLDELGFELTGLVLGGDPDGPVPEPARLTGRVAAPGIFEDLGLDGTILSKPGAVDLEANLTVSGHGLHGVVLAPYLRALGIEPVLEAGHVHAELFARLREDPRGWRADLAVRDAAIGDGERTLASLAELRIDEAILGADGIEVGEVVITSPAIDLARDPDGALRALGIRLVGTLPAEIDETSAPVAPPTPTASFGPALTLPELPPFRLGRLRVDDARIAWADGALEPPLDVRLVAAVEVLNLDTAGGSADFAVRLEVPGAIDAVELGGELSLSSEELWGGGNITVRGVRAGPFASLLPGAIAVATTDGRFTGEFLASVRNVAEGGLATTLVLGALQWSEGEAEPMLACDEVRLDVARLDPAAGVVEIVEARATGIHGEAARDAEGILHVAGLELGGASETPVVEEEAPADPLAGPAAVSTIPLPRITTSGPLTLGVERFTYRDASFGADAAPIEASVTLCLDGPAVLVDVEPRELAPLAWSVDGDVRGVVEHGKVHGTIAPFAEEPHFAAALRADGVRTAGVVELVPALASLLQGEVEEGVIEGSLDTVLFVRRARPMELGLSRPFGAEVLLEGLAYRDAPEGRILAGVDEVAIEVKRVDPARGLVHLESIEVSMLRAKARRGADGFHALGFVIAPVATEAPETEPISEAIEEEPAPIASSDDTPAGELRLDRLIVEGIDLEIIDDSVDPPIVIPVNQLEAEVKRFSTIGLLEGKPIRFDALIASEPPDGSVPVFEELTLAGRVALLPDPAGWVQLRLVGVELPRFAPLAQVAGVTVGDGALETSTRVRLKGTDGMRVDTSLAFSDLDLAEVEGGPIESGLSLPMSLDAALFLLRNPAGEHAFSVGFTIDRDGLTTGDIALAATQAFAGVVVGALTGMPLRLLGAMIPGGGDDDRQARARWELSFAPGSTQLDRASRDRLEEIARKLEGNRTLTAYASHLLTEADVARAELLANPTPEACLELVAGLRQRKAEILRLREERALEVRALHAVASPDVAPATESLRTLERELAEIEPALDHLLGIWRSDSPRQRFKRTRSFCREIGAERLAAISAGILAEVWSRRPDAIEIRSPRFDPQPGPEGGRIVIELRER